MVPVAGARLRVVTVGGARTETLVVLHGGPGESLDVVAPHFDTLADEGAQVVYYDQRGCGQSTGTPAGYETHIADLEAVREHLGCERLSLIGFSWGARLALLYAAAHPSRVAQLVLISPPTLLPCDLAAELTRALARPEVAAAIAAGVARGLAPYFAVPARALSLGNVSRNDAVAAAIDNSLRAVDFARLCDAAKHIPALVIHGAFDVTPFAPVEDLARRLGAQVVVLAHCGHAPFLEEPDRLLASIAQFTQAQLGNRAAVSNA